MKTLSFFLWEVSISGSIKEQNFSVSKTCFHVSLSISCTCRHNFKFDTKSEVALYKTLKNKLIARTFAILEDKFKIQI